MRVFHLSTDVDEQQMSHPGHRQLFDVWQRARDDFGSPLPGRQHLDLWTLKPILANLMLLQHLPAENDFVFRVFGTNIAAETGRDLTGRRISDGEDRASGTFFTGVYGEMIRDGRPRYCSTEAPSGAAVARWDRLILPLASDGRRVDRIIVASFPSAWRGDLPVAWPGAAPWRGGKMPSLSLTMLASFAQAI